VPSPTPTPIAAEQFQTGMAFPRWGTSVYGAADPQWPQGLQEIEQQTGARWVEMMVELYQDTPTSTYVHAGAATSPPADMEQGIVTAHRLGFQVFVVPHLDVLSPAGAWSGNVAFGDPAQAQAWFDSYWNAYEPYARIASAAGAEQLSIATELDGLQSVNATLWTQLIQRFAAIFPATLTCDINWNMIVSPQPWMQDPRLTYLGVSEYDSIAGQPVVLSETAIEAVWHQRLLPNLDTFSAAIRKPLIVSEIGYHNSSDALYNPWRHYLIAPADTTLQRDAYVAAVQALYGDPHIYGVYFWAWWNGIFAPSSDAASAILPLFGSPPSRPAVAART
jgi:hypothetical protein